MGKLSWQRSHRPEREAALFKRCELENGSFLPPYLQVYYSNLKLQGAIILKGVMQPL